MVIPGHGRPTECKEENDMKRISAILAAVFILAMLLTVAGCSKKSENSIAGTWAYSDEETGIGAVYVLNEDGTGTYTMEVGEETVTYELKYEVQDGHLLVTYVNNEIFSEDDVFDSAFRFEGSDKLIISDSTGEEMTFVKQ